MTTTEIVATIKSLKARFDESYRLALDTRAIVLEMADVCAQAKVLTDAEINEPEMLAAKATVVEVVEQLYTLKIRQALTNLS